ncbi:MAG: DUF2490 domain-containing protein [Bacteroidetes bacterium]|nr:DUF2490 domain-containing protein [Bacteroidota bacterium]
MKHVLNSCFYAVLFLLFFNVDAAHAQTKQTEQLNQVWVGYLNQTRFTKKWGAWADLHLRTKEKFVTNVNQTIVRLGITYYVNDAAKLTAGYAYVSHYPGDNHKEITQPEHRPWQQIQWHTKYGHKRMMQWIRLEEKYRRKILNDSMLANSYSFNWKLRYNLWYEIPFKKKAPGPKSWSFIANDEVHINFGKQVVNNYFDQNRFFLGLKYQFTDECNVQFGYTNVFQQLSAGNKYKNIDGARIFFFQNLVL